MVESNKRRVLTQGTSMIKCRLSLGHGTNVPPVGFRSFNGGDMGTGYIEHVNNSKRPRV